MLKDLKSIIEQGESEVLELKKSTAQMFPAFETICAFLNNIGGVLLIGVTDHGRIIGQEVSDATRREIANQIEKIEPAANLILILNMCLWVIKSM